MLGDLFNQDILHRMPRGLNGRDLHPIYEARDYLAQHYTKPPTIPELARLVGTNQTKLKARARGTRRWRDAEAARRESLRPASAKRAADKKRFTSL